MKKIKEFINKYERPIKTFFEGFFSYLALNILYADLTSTTAIESLIAGAIASAISVVINNFNKESD